MEEERKSEDTSVCPYLRVLKGEKITKEAATTTSFYYVGHTKEFVQKYVVYLDSIFHIFLFRLGLTCKRENESLNYFVIRPFHQKSNHYKIMGKILAAENEPAN